MNAHQNFNKQFDDLSSKNVDLTNIESCRKYLSERVHQLLEFSRIVVRNNSTLLNGINETYEKNIIAFLKYIPLKYMSNIYKTMELVFVAAMCVDLDKLLLYKELFKSIVGVDKFKDGKKNINKIKEILIVCIEKKFKEPSDCEFLKSLLGKLDPVLNCVMYLLENIPQCIENLQTFKTVDDIF